MRREIQWTKSARQTYLDILLYLQEKWGDETAIKFDKKVQSRISSIKISPFMFPATAHFRDKNIRRCVVSKQTSFYYQVDDNLVHILSFYDNRRNPEGLELE